MSVTNFLLQPILFCFGFWFWAETLHNFVCLNEILAGGGEGLLDVDFEADFLLLLLLLLLLLSGFGF